MLPADILCRSHGYAPEPGTFIAIIGPSGVGKDSLIAGARQVFRHSPAFHFARRVITREPDSTEDHVPVSIEDFLNLERDGKFSLSWQANGLGYGLPLTVHDDLARGNNVVANISRAVVPEMRARFLRSLVIHVTAEPHLIVKRLQARGRETGPDQQARIERSMRLDKNVEADIRIENNASLEQAVRQLVSVLNVYVMSPRLRR